MVKVSLILFVLTIIMNSSFALTIDNENRAILRRAKRNFLCKEKEYLKTRPISQKLRDFIKRHKRKTKYSAKKTRAKHSIEDIYSLNEDLLPLSDVQFRDVREDNGSNPQQDSDKFTVSSFLLPIANDSLCEDYLESSKMTKTKTAKTRPKPTSISTISTTQITSATIATNISATSLTRKTTKEENDIYDDDDDEVIVDHTTKGKILHRVIEDVQELIRMENQPRSDGDYSLCNVTGDWDSYAGGMQIRIFPQPNSKTPKIQIIPREPPMDGFLSESNWNVTAVTPFPSQSLIAVTATTIKGKRIATFLGECRICDGSHTITGYWMIRRHSKSCKDREEANTFVSDVLRRNNVRKLQKDHLKEMEVTTKENQDNENQFK